MNGGVALALNLVEISEAVGEAAAGLCRLGRLKPEQILVVGCSTSEIAGKQIGSAGSSEVAEAVLAPLLAVTGPLGIYLAVQCCEHLNRVLVVEEEAQQRYDLPLVTVSPTIRAGGALAASALERFSRPVTVEEIKAHAGMDIGGTLIGMHLRPVAVPARLAVDRVGHAPLVTAITRPKLVGGERACYPQ